MSVFEAGMMVCFGVSWPIAAYKTYKAKCVHGKSFAFSCLIMLGYVFGIIHKLFCYNELKRYLGNITFKTLTDSLKDLEKDGLINRKEYPQIPPKVEYSLTQKAESLIPILTDLCIWGEKNK